MDLLEAPVLLFSSYISNLVPELVLIYNNLVLSFIRIPYPSSLFHCPQSQPLIALIHTSLLTLIIDYLSCLTYSLLPN